MPIIGTDLYILYTFTDVFADLDRDKKAVFRLFLAPEDRLTLAVWTSGGTDYDNNDPKFELKTHRPSGLKWKAKQFLGDQKIGSKMMKRIMRAIEENPTATHIVFTPKTDDDFPNQIAFEVSIGILNADAFLPMLAIGSTNPSPPRNSRVIS